MKNLNLKEQKFRIWGYKKRGKKKVYVEFTFYKEQLYYSFSKSPTKWKSIYEENGEKTLNKLMAIQFTAQKELIDVKWELQPQPIWQKGLFKS